VRGSWRFGTARPHSPRIPCSGTESGGILPAALVLTFLVSVLVLGLSREVSLGLKVEERLEEGARAFALAESGLEVAARMPLNDDDWRGTLGTGEWISNQAIGSGAITVTADDPQDGEILVHGPSGSSSADTVRLVATAEVGSIRRRLRADYVPLPHPALRNAIFGEKLVSLKNISIEGRVRSNESVTDNGGVDLHGHITTREGKDVSETLRGPYTEIFYTDEDLDLPEVNFQWFRQAGEEIRPPTGWLLAGTVVTRDHNPFGLSSPRGIYWINARGADFCLRNVAIEASLAILNARVVYVGGAGHESCYFRHRSPDPDRLPALVVEGDLTMRIEGGTVAIGSAGGGVSITSGITGAVYCTGVFRGPQQYGEGRIQVDGAILAEEAIIMGSDCLVRHNPGFTRTALVEMARPELRLVPGTVRTP